MIGKLKGVVDCVGEEEAVIDVNGVGYLVSAGSRTLARLEPGKPVALHIETHVREDQFKLFGFLSDSERAWFVRLQSVQGVGAKHALAMLDAIEVGDVESSAILGDASTFERAKGVGKKLAQRIATELKDKAPPLGRSLGAGVAGLAAALAPAGADAPTTAPAPKDNVMRESAVSALVNLGYSESDARKAAAEAIELTAKGDSKTSKVVGKTLDEIPWPKDVTVGAIIRGDEVIIAHGHVEIQSEDHVILFLVDKKHIREVEKLFQVGFGFI